MPTSHIELVIACKSWQEAQAIADELLEQKLVRAVEIMEAASKDSWKHAIGFGHPVKLIVETTEKKAPRVRLAIYSFRHGEVQPPYALSNKKLPNEVIKWLRGATEVKSVKLKR